MHSSSAMWAAIVASAVELGLLSWCVFYPVKDLLPSLGTLKSWEQVYGVAVSNIDVWLAALVRSLIMWIIASAAPSTPPSRYGTTSAASHSQLRLALTILTTVFELTLMAKSTAVAVWAPEQVWPSPSHPGEVLNTPYCVGLVYIFSSVGIALLGSLVQAGLCSRLVTLAQKKYEAPPEPHSLEAPLLGGASAAVATGDKAAAGAVGPDGKPVSGDGKKAVVKPKVSSKTIWMLLRMSSHDWPVIAVAFVFGSAAALAQACVPYYTGLTIDYASIDPDRAKFQHTVLLLVLVSGACGVAAGIRGGLFTVAMSSLNVRLRKQLFHALVSMEVGFFDVTKTGEITSRLAADTSTVSDQVCLNLNVMLRSITQAAMVLAFMFSANWRLTIITFILVPAVMTISKIYGRFFAALAKRVQSELAEANSVAEEVLSSMATVKAHAAQDSAEAAYSGQLDKYFVLLVKEAVVYAAYTTANTFLPNSVSALVLLYGGHLVLDGQMSPGALVSFMLYQQSLSTAFQMLGDVFGALTAAVGAADKVLELMHRKPEIDAGGSLVPVTFNGQIELKDVVFIYPARPNQQVLRGLSLEVPPGQVVALVGPSGGGKSSIVKLVERFYLPTSGQVLLDGRDVGVYHPKWLRRQVAMVSQEPVLYARSVRRNICYGLEAEDGIASPPTQEDVEEAARQANAHEFITNFPEGYETNCGEKGVTLSGGQKQRLAIARALVRRPKVLLLDEATSALDADSESVVQQALDRVMAGRTVLVIAHRLSTIQNADRIIVIGNGTVQEMGTHEELLANSGTYATLVKRQLAKSPSQYSLPLASQVTQLTPVSGSGTSSPPRCPGGPAAMTEVQVEALAGHTLRSLTSDQARNVQPPSPVSSGALDPGADDVQVKGGGGKTG